MDYEPIGRLPPQNIEAEKSVLGSLMLEPDLGIDIFDKLEPDDFYRTDHKKIYEAIKTLSIKSEPIDICTVEEELKRRGANDEIGGLIKLTELIDAVPTTANALNYTKIIIENSKRRKLIKACQETINNCYDCEDIDETVNKAENSILEVNKKVNSDFVMAKEAAMKALDSLEERMKNKGKLFGLSTGFRDLNYKTGGLLNSELIIIAGRPAMGKTSLAENIMTHVAFTKGQPVALFSLEMSQEQIVNRMFSAWGSVDNERIKLGTIKDRDMENIAAVYGAISESKLVIDDTAGIKVSEIRSKCHKIKKKLGDLRLIVIDHLTLLWRPCKEKPAAEHEQNILALKSLAKEMGCPIVLLQQINRASEKGTADKRPGLSDLKETGAAEETASLVMLLYRDEYYNPDTPKKGIAEVIIAKNRYGATGVVELNWQGQYTRFSNIKREYKQTEIEVRHEEDNRKSTT